MEQHRHVCGCFYLETTLDNWHNKIQKRTYLPQVSLSCHARIVSTVVRSSLTQTYVNTSTNAVPELRYAFPLYDGVSVVGFTCTVNKDRVIRGVVQEKNQARQTYDEAVAQGQTAGLLEQVADASDVFLISIGNVPANAEIKVDITYLGELKHDAQIDGTRFTLPTSIAPRYGILPSPLSTKPINALSTEGINIVVDAEMPTGCAIRSIQSPSHPISVSIGSLSTSTSDAAPSLQLASATLSLGTAELGKDFVLQIVATNTSDPVAILETHPTVPQQRALMATLVPRFNLPSSRPEIVFICDRSGSMSGGKKMPNLKSALQIFLKSLPVGVKFNICSFGTHHSYLFPEGSKTYDQSSLETAMRYVEGFAADFGGTNIANPVQETFTKRYKDMDLDVFVLTDGEVWGQQELFDMVNKNVEESNGAIRLFTLGVGDDVSHALVEGLARAGNGFSQTVAGDEKMDSKVVRMLKGALTPHIKDYSLEIKYDKGGTNLGDDDDDDFVVVEKVFDALNLSVTDVEDQNTLTGTPSTEPKAKMSLFDPNVDPDVEINEKQDRYAHLPAVPVPKLLQAPSTIPPLYPFNRTTVYLLLSPDTTQATPESVILRGTSAHGPLELEIPITILETRAETIHQLAARKAVKELEEGRGWVAEARDSDGKRLKNKFEGRFSDMVEREAVRLGLQYQIAGKWCSFVAVEDEDQSGTKTTSTIIESKSTSRGFPHNQFGSVRALAAGGPGPQYQTARYRRGGATLSNVMGSFGAGPPGGGAMDRIMPAGRQAAFGFATASAGRGKKKQSSPAPQAFQAAAAMRSHTEEYDPTIEVRDDSPRQAFQATVMRSSAVDPTIQMRPDVRAGMSAPRTYDSFADSPTQSFQATSMRSHNFDPSIEMKDDSHAGMLADFDFDSFVVPFPSDSPLHAVVRLQTFSGYWSWSEQLFALLKVDESAVASKLQSMAAGVSKDVLATVAVISYLRKKLSSEKDAWEMLVDKAITWLEGELGGAPDAMIDAADELFVQ